MEIEAKYIGHVKKEKERLTASIYEAVNLKKQIQYTTIQTWKSR